MMRPGEDESCESVPVSASYRHVPAVPTTNEPAPVDDPSRDGCNADVDVLGGDALGAAVACDSCVAAAGTPPFELGVASEQAAANPARTSSTPIACTKRMLIHQAAEGV